MFTTSATPVQFHSWMCNSNGYLEMFMQVSHYSLSYSSNCVCSWAAVNPALSFLRDQLLLTRSLYRNLRRTVLFMGVARAKNRKWFYVTLLDEPVLMPQAKNFSFQHTK